MSQLNQKIDFLFTSSGIKKTDLRCDILKILLKSKKPISAYDILKDLVKKRENAKAMTVYRILNSFEECNILHKIEKDNTYIACCHPDDSVCQIVSCPKCHQYTELHDDKISKYIKDKVKSIGYSYSNPVLQIEALCSKCNKK